MRKFSIMIPSLAYKEQESKFEIALFAFDKQ